MCQKAIFGKKGIPDSVAILKKKIGNLFSWVLYVFFKFFFLKLHKWQQVAQSITYCVLPSHKQSLVAALLDSQTSSKFNKHDFIVCSIVAHLPHFSCLFCEVMVRWVDNTAYYHW